MGVYRLCNSAHCAVHALHASCNMDAGFVAIWMWGLWQHGYSIDYSFQSLVLKSLTLSLLPSISLQVWLASVHCAITISSLEHLRIFLVSKSRPQILMLVACTMGVHKVD